MSRGSGSVEGQDEIFIFTERVIKEDIKVKFFQVIFFYKNQRYSLMVNDLLGPIYFNAKLALVIIAIFIKI